MGSRRFRSCGRKSFRSAAVKALSDAAAARKIKRCLVRTGRVQKAKAVIVPANGAEPPRLLLLSASKQFPNGLANSSGYVGKNLMLNSGGISLGLFDEQLNDYKGFAVSRILHDFYELDAQKVGFYGGGGPRGSIYNTPINFAGGRGVPPHTPRRGKKFKDGLSPKLHRTVEIFFPRTSLPHE